MVVCVTHKCSELVRTRDIRFFNRSRCVRLFKSFRFGRRRHLEWRRGHEWRVVGRSKMHLALNRLWPGLRFAASGVQMIAYDNHMSRGFQADYAKACE